MFIYKWDTHVYFEIIHDEQHLVKILVKYTALSTRCGLMKVVALIVFWHGNISSIAEKFLKFLSWSGTEAHLLKIQVQNECHHPIWDVPKL